MIKAYRVHCYNPHIDKYATFVIYGKDEEEIRKKYLASFIAASGMDIESILEIPDFFIW